MWTHLQNQFFRLWRSVSWASTIRNPMCSSFTACGPICSLRERPNPCPGSTSRQASLLVQHLIVYFTLPCGTVHLTVWTLFTRAKILAGNILCARCSGTLVRFPFAKWFGCTGAALWFLSRGCDAWEECLSECLRVRRLLRISQIYS